MLIDSYPNQDRYETTQILLEWLQDSHFARNMPFDSVSWSIVSSNALPTNRPVQYDSTSCGVFVALTAAYWMWYHRLPTSEDFTQQTIPKLRSFMLYVLSLSWTHNKHSWLHFWNLTCLCNRPLCLNGHVLVVWL